MHVGLNLVFLVPGATGGTETYARELIEALVTERPDVRLTAFVSREARAAGGSWVEEVAAVTVPVRATNRLEWVRGEQLLLPRLAARSGVDLVHSLASTAPAWGAYRRVTTIHDLHYRTIPEAHFGLRGLGMRALVPLAARRSHRVITVSAASREELVSILSVPPDKLDVVPNGVGSRPRATPLSENEIRARHRLTGRRVLLTTSAKRPHKNLRRLLDALAQISRDDRPVLMLPGYPTEHETELRAHAAALGLAEDTRFLGWVDESELEGLFAVADGFVFPSLAEGFGLPVLEAMARGVPVACSRTGAVGEVAGDAALLFDPLDVAAIARALTELLDDLVLGERLSAAGRRRAAAFPWERTARETVAVYERTLS